MAKPRHTLEPPQAKAEEKRRGVTDKEDKHADMSFPASDPPARGGATGTEPPGRPANRKPPRIDKHEVERSRKKVRGET